MLLLETEKTYFFENISPLENTLSKIASYKNGPNFSEDLICQISPTSKAQKKVRQISDSYWSHRLYTLYTL